MRKSWRNSAMALIGAATLAMALGVSTTSASAASGTYLSDSSKVSPGGGCKIWENYKGSGSTYALQGLVLSWGDHCQMGVYRSHNGGPFELVSYLYETGADQLSTGFHADGPGYKEHTCLLDITTRFRICDRVT
jgi:hypothetical protein